MKLVPSISMRSRVISSTISGGAKLRCLVLENTCRALLDWTAEGGCPHVVRGQRPNQPPSTAMTCP
jgi:hypothetical protein